MNIISAKDVVKKYGNGEVEVFALNHVTVDIKKGEITTILGPSGSGKTTLLNTLAGVDNVTSGEIILNEKENIAKYSQSELTTYRRNHIGFIFQSYNLISNLSVKENIEIGKDLSKNPNDIDEIIELVGLKGLEDKMIYQISGGQQQRVAIARVLVKNPEIIFCDEPTGALDEENGKNILELLQKLNKDFGTTIIMVTHNPNIADISHRVLTFKDGNIIKDKTNAKIKKAQMIKWA